MIVPFGAWLPDRPAFQNPGATVARNVIPGTGFYRPLPDLAASSSNALTGRCLGLAAAQTPAGNVEQFAGDATKLYLLSSTSWTDISKGGGYTNAADDIWEFAQFKSRIVATNFADPVQGRVLGSGSNFADLFTSTLKPKARHIASVRQFLVAGNTFDTTDGAVPNRVWWSEFDNPLNMDPGAATQSDYEDIREGGWVQRIVGGLDFGLVFLERAIHRMSYVGSPIVFRFDPIDRERGTPFPNSVIGLGRFVAFISPEGFFITDGTASQPIGEDKVDKTFWSLIDTQYAARITAAVDPVNKVVLWAFPTTSSSGEAARIFLWHWPGGQWSDAEVTVQQLARMLTRGYTLEELDAFGTMETLPYSLDSRYWMGGNIVLAAIDPNRKLAYFNGANLGATLETAEFQPYPGRKAMIREVRPLVNGGTLTAAIAARTLQSDAVSYGSAGSPEAEGHIPFTTKGRYHRVRASIAAGGTWDHAQGVEVEARQLGKF